MSDFSGSESNRYGYDSYGEGSVSVSIASELPGTAESRNRALRPTQILGNAWIFYGYITTDQLHAVSESIKILKAKTAYF